MIQKHKYILLLNAVAIFIIILVMAFVVNFTEANLNIQKNNRAYSVIDGWILRSDGIKDREVTLPDRISGEGSTYIEINNVFPTDTTDGDYLFIRASQQEVYVYADGRQIYVYDTASDRLFGKTSVRTWLEIPLNSSYAGKDLTIRYTSVYDNYRGILNNVYFGTRQGIMRILLGRYWPKLVITLLFFIMGVASMLMFIFFRRTSQRMYTLQYLGLFSLVVAMWLGSENMLMQFVYNNAFVLNMLSFVALGGIPIPVLMYIDEIEEHRYNSLFTAFVGVNIANIFIQFILAANQIFDYIDMLPVTHILIFVSAAVIIGTLFVIKKAEESNSRIISFIKAAIIFGFSGLCEVIMYYLNPRIDMVGFFVGIGGLIFSAMLIYFNAREMVEIEKQREQAVDANNAKTQFLAKISHELRTPINIIVGMDDLIMDEDINQNIKEYALNIKTSAHTILTLVNDLLDVSKMESGRMDIVPVQYEPHKLIRSTGDIFRPKAEEKGIKFNLRMGNDIPKLLHGDPTRIQQIMINLLSNAVKYTKSGHIDFAVTCHNENDMCYLLVAVADTGMGISEKYLPHVFDTFSRANHPNIEGSGLGLSITKQLVELMDGKIDVESVVGEGSCFTVTIPQKIIQNEDGSSAKSKLEELADLIKDNFSEKRVLVVDDNALNLQIIKNFLKNVSVSSDCVLSGEDCLRACTKKKYDLIFMDHMMPELDGIETLKRLREDEGNQNQHTKVVALTANALEGLREKYIARGFDEYLPKPVDKQVIYELLIKMFGE